MRPGTHTNPDAQDAATDWVMRLDRGELSAGERAELDAWLAADSRNRGAFARTQAMWSTIRQVGAEVGNRPAAAPARKWGFVASRLRLAASIGVLALLAGGAFGAFQFYAGREISELGEVRRIALDDGSTLVLNTSSRARIRFSDRERRVVLQGGEASFLVAKHDPRPFIVQARDVSVRAVGTAFVVRMRASSVSVTVNEGVVEVVRPAEGQMPRERQRLSASRQLNAVVAEPIQLTALSRSEVNRQLAWQDGFVIFDGESLLHAVQEVNRYSTVPVEIDDSVMQGKPFFGVFRTGDSRAFAYAVATLYNAHVNEEAGKLRVSAD